jgi:hypothetical protein
MRSVIENGAATVTKKASARNGKRKSKKKANAGPDDLTGVPRSW